jgi:phage tail-like protein
MADDGSKQSANVWPTVKFSFQVKWDGDEIIFQEVSGLDAETQVIEYRGGSSKVYSTVKMPGLIKYGNVTFKKGIFQKDTALWQKFSALKMNTIKRANITVSLLDENGAPAMTWTLSNAFPTKITGTDMKSDSNEVAVESIEVAHEGMVVSS